MKTIEHHLSKDGSSTLYANQFGQFYHNPNGAISESRHVFFEQSGFLEFLKQQHQQPISIFEMGFGTGLNFLLLMEYIDKLEVTCPIHFYTVEAFPAPLDIIRKINYSNSLDIDFSNRDLHNIFTQLTPRWNHFSFLDDGQLRLSLFLGSFDQMPPIASTIHYFFHDPFSPEVNSELWSVETFQKLRSCATTDAVLSTYCAASKARACMAKAGWLVAKAEGALGKREMTIASLEAKKLIHLKRVNELRLIERFDNGDFKL